MRFLKNIFSLDLRSLAVFRIALAFAIIGDLVVRATDLVAHYSDLGVLPRGVLLEQFGNKWHLSLYFIGGTPAFQAVLMGIAALFAIMLLIGYKTRFSTILSWIFLISIQSRNPMILQGGDMLFHMLLFWSMFLPLGAVYSVDSALDDSGQKKPQTIFNGATIALYLQFLIFYWFSVVYKTGYEWWGDGTAVYYALNADHHATAFGHFLLANASPVLLQLLTYATLLIETIGPALLILTGINGMARLGVILLFILMHIGFSSALEVGIFPWVSSIYMLAFLPSRFWGYLQGKMTLKPLKIYYDGDCGFCKKMVHLLKTLLLLLKSSLSPAQSDAKIQKVMKKHHSWVVVDSRGKTFTKFEALALLFRHSPLFWPLSPALSWKWVRKLGNTWYEWVASHRPFAARCMRWCQFRPHNWRSTRLGSFLAAFCIVYILFWNMVDLQRWPLRMPESLAWIGHTFRIDQQWNMFSPFPMKDDGWFVIPAKLKNGLEIDLFTGKFPPDYSKPELVSGLYKNFRWDKYMRNISARDLEKHRLYYGQYLCRDWNTRFQGDNQLESFDIIFMKEVTKPDYQPLDIQKEVLWRHNCFK